MGEEIFRTIAFTCIRNLQNPKSTTAAEGQHPDTYHGQFWDNNQEPHNNSTVLSHWYYLLSQGGNGTNDIGSTFNVAGIGINNAQLIAYRAESVYLNSSANYAAARNATIQAARDLFGTGSCTEIAVTSAWYAVGVGAAYPTNGLFTITSSNGTTTICTSNAFTLSAPAGTLCTWSAYPSGIVTLNPTTGFSTTATKSTNGNINLYANISCGVNTNVIRSVRVGPYSHSDYTIYSWPNTICYGQNVQFGPLADQVPNATSYNWIYPSGGWTYVSGQGTRVITLKAPIYDPYTTGGDVGLSVGNACGTSSYFPLTHFPYSQCFKPSYVISPNPTSNILKIQPDDESKSIGTNLKIQQVQLIDKFGATRYDRKFGNTSSVTISVSGLISGSYVLRIFDGKSWYSEKVIIQH